MHALTAAGVAASQSAADSATTPGNPRNSQVHYARSAGELVATSKPTPIAPVVA